MASPLLSLFKEQLENESNKLAAEHALQKRGDHLIWWYFLRLESLDAVEIAEIVCDDGNDLGLDALRIDENGLVHFYNFKHPQDMKSSFPEGEVDKVLGGLRLILSRKYENVANDQVKGRVEEIFQIVPTGYRLHLVTSGTGTSKEAKNKLDNFVSELAGPSPDFFSWILEDLPYLQDSFYRKTLPVVEDPLLFEITKQPPYQVRIADHDCYLFHSDGTVLAKLYEQFGEQLLQQNIRVHQGDKGTNASIRQTATGSESSNFLHYNNGVTFLCEAAGWDQFVQRLTVTRAQVVNGGQTIRMIHEAYTAGTLKADVLVPMRVITSQGDKEFANNVAVNQNNQNRIEASFLRSNHPRIIQLAHSLASTGWYLERRENEVEQLTVAERAIIEQRIGSALNKRIIKLKEGTQAYVATYYRHPELAKKNVSKIFLGPGDGGFFEGVFSNELSAEKFVIAHQIKRSVDEFIRQFMTRRRKKDKVADWHKDYAEVLGPGFVAKHSDVVDQVVPQSSIFLCALVFEMYVRLAGRSAKDLVEELATTGNKLLVDMLTVIVDFAKDHPAAADRSWPTLLKSQSFFENVVSFLKGQMKTSPRTKSAKPGRK